MDKIKIAALSGAVAVAASALSEFGRTFFKGVTYARADKYGVKLGPSEELKREIAEHNAKVDAAKAEKKRLKAQRKSRRDLEERS